MLPNPVSIILKIVNCDRIVKKQNIHDCGFFQLTVEIFWYNHRCMNNELKLNTCVCLFNYWCEESSVVEKYSMVSHTIFNYNSRYAEQIINWWFNWIILDGNILILFFTCFSGMFNGSSIFRGSDGSHAYQIYCDISDF